MNYSIVLYNRGRKIKTISKFHKYGEAVRSYEKLIHENVVIFPRLYNCDGKKSSYELVLLGPKGGKSIEYVRDDMDRLIPIKPPKNRTIKKITPYQIEDTFKNKFNRKLYNFKSLISELLLTNDELSFYVFNNKLVIENIDTERLNVFILKNKQDTFRLVDTIKKFSIANGYRGFLFFPYSQEKYKKRIRNKLIEEYGLKRTYLKKISTR